MQMKTKIERLEAAEKPPAEQIFVIYGGSAEKIHGGGRTWSRQEFETAKAAAEARGEKVKVICFEPVKRPGHE